MLKGNVDTSLDISEPSLWEAPCRVERDKEKGGTPARRGGMEMKGLN